VVEPVESRSKADHKLTTCCVQMKPILKSQGCYENR